MKVGNIKFILLVALAFAVSFAAYFFMGSRAVDIEDTNGPEDMSLAVLTEADIINRGKGTIVGGPKTKEHKGHFLGVNVSSGTRYFQDDFSGVYVLQQWDILWATDLYFTLYDFQVTGGNFQMYMLYEDEIIATIQPGAECTFHVNEVMEKVESGKYYLVIAGESAAFEFTSFDLEDEV